MKITSLEQLEKRLDALEERTRGINSRALLNPQSVDPSTAKFLDDFAAVSYISTGTAFITTVPNRDGYLKLAKSTTGKYYLYAYVGGAWRGTEITSI